MANSAACPRTEIMREAGFRGVNVTKEYAQIFPKLDTDLQKYCTLKGKST